MDVSPLIRQQIIRKFGDYKESGSELRINCPFCVQRGHRSKEDYKLYLNLEKNVSHCFRCEYAGKVTDLTPQLSLLEFDFGHASKSEIQSQNADEVEPLPKGYSISELPQNHAAQNYIEGRGFDFVELSRISFYCENYKKGDYSFGPRLVFPIYQFGSYRGFQARAIGDMEPKYLTASGMKKSELLYGYDEVIKGDEIIITEGIFDCLRVGSRAVAAFGKVISDTQLRLVALGNFKRVILLLDRDAWKEIKKSAVKLAKDFNTFVGCLSNKDPASMTRNEIDLFLQTELQRIY